MTDTSRPRTRIVVGVDGSEPSKNALRWGAHLAALSDAVIDAVTVWEYPISYGWTYPPSNWEPKADSEKMLNATVDEVFGPNRPVAIRLLVGEGDVARILMDQCERAMMLVVGSRGHGGFTGLLLGSVSSKCAEHAACPVLVVHGAPPPQP